VILLHIYHGVPWKLFILVATGDIDHSCVPFPCSKKKNLQIAGTKKICLQNVENSSMGVVPFFAFGKQVLAVTFARELKAIC
jgi:hypothetical protein